MSSSKKRNRKAARNIKCSATSTRTGKRCEAWAMAGKDVCYHHGGATPGGIASPHFKTGRHSKYIPARLTARYAEGLADETLLQLRDEIALLDARLVDVLKRVDTGEAGSLWRDVQQTYRDLQLASASGDPARMRMAMLQHDAAIKRGVEDYAAWDEVLKLIDQRRRLVESEQKQMERAGLILTMDQAFNVIGAVLGIIKERVNDRDTRAAIQADVNQLIAANTG